MNLSEKYGPIANRLSIGQYCPPKCFELAGKEFKFIMDSGEETGDITLNFLDETTVAYSVQNGKRSGEAKYECRKGDDWTYLVTYCLYDPRENHTVYPHSINRVQVATEPVIPRASASRCRASMAPRGMVCGVWVR